MSTAPATQVGQQHLGKLRQEHHLGDRSNELFFDPGLADDQQTMPIADLQAEIFDQLRSAQGLCRKTFAECAAVAAMEPVDSRGPLPAHRKPSERNDDFLQTVWTAVGTCCTPKHADEFRTLCHPKNMRLCEERKMQNILFAWELGSGLGHLNRLIAIAKHFEFNNNIFFVIPGCSNTERHIRAKLSKDVFIIKTKTQTSPFTEDLSKVETRTLADVLHLLGFADLSLLNKYYKLWVSIIEYCRPKLIVSDFSPMLRLAADGSIPVVVVGNGYTIPPAGRILPPLRPWDTDVPESSRIKEEELIGKINVLRGEQGLDDFMFLADIFSGDETFVCTFPLFDPYQSFRQERPTTPFNIPYIKRGEVRRMTGEGADVFVYLPAGHPLRRKVLASLDRSHFNVLVYIPGISPSDLKHQFSRLNFLREAADLSKILPHVRLLIHHGGLGTAYAGVMAGTPQLVLPTNLEHLITSRALLKSGVAQGFSANIMPDVEQLSKAICIMTTEKAWLERACEVANSLSEICKSDGVEKVIMCCKNYLHSR